MAGFRQSELRESPINREKGGGRKERETSQRAK